MKNSNTYCDVNIQPNMSFVFTTCDNAISIEPVVFQHLNEIANLENNWDGHGALTPNISTLSHIKAFLKNLDDRDLSRIAEENIFPNPHGTITVRVAHKKNYVNIEFGESYANYYTFIDKRIKYKTQKATHLYKYIPYDLKLGISEVFK